MPVDYAAHLPDGLSNLTDSQGEKNILSDRGLVRFSLADPSPCNFVTRRAVLSQAGKFPHSNSIVSY